MSVAAIVRGAETNRGALLTLGDALELLGWEIATEGDPRGAQVSMIGVEIRRVLAL